MDVPGGVSLFLPLGPLEGCPVPGYPGTRGLLLAVHLCKRQPGTERLSSPGCSGVNPPALPAAGRFTLLAGLYKNTSPLKWKGWRWRRKPGVGAGLAAAVGCLLLWPGQRTDSWLCGRGRAAISSEEDCAEALPLQAGEGRREVSWGGGDDLALGGGHSEPIQEVMLKVERAVWLLICPSVMLFGAGPEAVKLLSSLWLPWTVWGGGAGPKGPSPF